MSDYINIKDDRFWQILFDEACVEGKQAERIQKELEQIAVDEKEIIRKPFERVVERLEEIRETFDDEWLRTLSASAYQGRETIDIVKRILKEECGIHERD